MSVKAEDLEFYFVRPNFNLDLFISTESEAKVKKLNSNFNEGEDSIQ